MLSPSKSPEIDEDEERILPPIYSEADIDFVPQALKRAEYAPIDYQQHEAPEGFWFTDGHPRYRKGFRYETCVPDLSLPSLLYSQCEMPPFKAGINQLDRSLFLAQNDDGVVFTDKGFRSARANVCIRGDGVWYFEVEVVKSNEPGQEAHVRAGIARREASVEAPVGADIYGYGVQDGNGDIVHAARRKDFMTPFKTGDVIGFEVCIPRGSLPLNTRRRRYPMKFKESLYFEAIDYKPPKKAKEMLLPQHYQEPKAEDLIEGSYVKVYKNGELQGTAFNELREFLPPHSFYDPAFKLTAYDDGLLGYYPMISVFKGGQAKFNLGPDFHSQPPGTKSLSERYDEQIADDVVLDIVDEAIFEEVDERNPKASIQTALENQTTPVPDESIEQEHKPSVKDGAMSNGFVKAAVSRNIVDRPEVEDSPAGAETSSAEPESTQVNAPVSGSQPSFEPRSNDTPELEARNSDGSDGVDQRDSQPGSSPNDVEVVKSEQPHSHEPYSAATESMAKLQRSGEHEDVSAAKETQN